eukprot:5941481-Pleurochrysis_carterae.AAC.1
MRRPRGGHRRSPPDVHCHGDMPLSALDDSGRPAASSGTECRFANIKAIRSPPTPLGTRLVLPFRRAGGLYEWRVVTRGRLPQTPASQCTRAR